MAKNSITDYSKTASLNTDIQSVDIDEGCLPSGINNAIRELMADLAAVNDGTVALTSPAFTSVDINSGTIDGVIIGGASAAAGTFTTFTSTGIDDNASSTAVTIDSSGRVGIGTSSPAKDLHIVGGDFSGLRIVHETNGTTFNLQSDSSGNTQLNATTATDITFLTTNFERMRIDSSGNVGIGTVPKSNYQANYKSSIEFPYGGLSGNSTGIETNLAANAYRSSDGSWKRLKTFNATRLSLNLGSSNDPFVFSYAANDTAGSTINWLEAMRIDSSGNVGIGESNPLSILHVGSGLDANVPITLAPSTGGNVEFRNTSGTGTFTFTNANGSSERMRIDGSGNVGIGTSSPATALDVNGTINVRTSGYQFGRITTNNVDTNNGGLTFQTISGGSFSERMRIDGSGNVLVGKTSTTNATTTVGFHVQPSGVAVLTRDGAAPLRVSRKTSDGEIISIHEDGTTIGKIGTYVGYPYYGHATQSGAGLLYVSTSIRPFDCNTETQSDNEFDLGTPTTRFDDVYATNGTIQTSDANEKQQISSLTDAEITAAKAISKLFKTFKWNDKVEAKGDAARTHTGVIAQDVQQAMTDAGLDAGNYAFFISATWWETQTEVPAVEADEENGIEAADAYTRTDTYDTAEEAPEGATERTRLGIRYPELLAFVGAATEQRLSNIETRLTQLETN